MHKRWILIVTPVLLISFACQAVSGLGQTIRGSGNIVSESRTVSGFDSISVCCGMQLSLTQGTEESLQIEADDNLLPEITSTVSGSKLTIQYKQQGTLYRPTRPVKLQVSAIHIRNLEISGGGRLDAGSIDTDQLGIDLSGGSQADLGAVTADSLKVGLSGGGGISLADLSLTSLEIELSGGSKVSTGALKADTLKLDSSGGGEITLAGSVAEQNITMSGGGQYEAGDLESQTATIEMSGGGKATLWVKERLDANLSGGTQVEYYGTPSTSEQLSGGSKLTGLGEK
jgi:predicted small secreted protein